MENLRFKTMLSLLSVLLLFIIGCNQGGEKASDTAKNPDNVAGTVSGNGTIESTQVAVEEMLEGDTMNYRQSTPPAFKAQFKKVVDSYLTMKDAFVKDNTAEVGKQAKLMMAALQQMPDSQLPQNARAFWKEKKDFLIEHLNLYQEAENMQEMRKNFAFLSTIMVKSVQAFGYTGQKLYVDYCPMANDNRGAYWLSQSKTIQNPYMGHKMPNCGEVKKEI